MIDAMAHLEDPRVVDPAALLERASAAGVTDVVNASFSPERPLTGRVRSASGGVRVHRAAGLHPLAIETPRLDEQLARVAEQCTGAVALGEIGLDARPQAVSMEIQRHAFERQLALSRIQELPIVVHCVQAWGPLLESLQRFWPLRGIVHGYSGSVELLSQFERLGLVPSFGGAVTRERFRRVRAAAARCGRFCIESDTPDHPPEGVSESEPAVLPRLVAAIAEIRGESPDSVRATTVRCAQETFTLPSVQ